MPLFGPLYTPANVAITGGTVKVNDGTAAAPSYSFASSPSSGMFISGGFLQWTSLGLLVGGLDSGGFSSTAYRIGATPASPDVFLTRDAANTLAQRNGAAAQAFRLYNTFTDAANYERFDAAWLAGELTLQIGSAGTGVATRGLKIAAGSGVDGDIFLNNSAGLRLRFGASSVFVDSGGLRLSSTTPLIWNTDNTADIGASGATRPRTLYVGTSVVTPAAGYLKHTPVTIASLPAAATAGAGARAFVSDATTQVFGGTVVGGGTINTPVYSDGTAWRAG